MPFISTSLHTFSFLSYLRSSFLHTMASKSGFQAFFKSEAYASSFKRGEMVTSTFARMLVEQSNVITSCKSNPKQSLVILDNACGTGVVSSILNEQLDSNSKAHWRLTCGDISSEILKYTQHRMEDENWQNAETQLVDAQSPELPSSFYDYIFTAFAYMALPKSIKALDVRMLKPNGVIAFSTWIEPGWITVARRAIQQMPGHLPFPETTDLLKKLTDGEWHSVDWIKSQLEERDFEGIDIRVETAKITLGSSVFVDMSMLMLPIMMKSFWTEEQREMYEPRVHAALVEYVEDAFGYGKDVETEWVAIISTARKAN
ncbi:unnamed protein product [Penicillium salamii]|nr:unnamed protein product [Penicillium salamii]